MDYKIVICSHNRSEILKKKTLAFLCHHKIPLSSICIFVAPEEVEVYKAVLPEYDILPGRLTLAANRNAVIEYFPEGTPLFFMDDDVRNFLISRDNKLKPLENLDRLITDGFLEARQRGISLWGLYPVPNAKWLSNTVSVGLVFCYGCSFGLFNWKGLIHDFCFKEDFERCLKIYQKDGKLLRLNWVAPQQSYSAGSGGLNQTRTLEKEKQGCERLVALFPSLVFLKKQKKNKHDIYFPQKLSKKESPQFALIQ